MASLFHEIYDVLAFWGHNLKTNFYNTFSNIGTRNFIRLIIIVGAYALIRPYLIKLGARAQRKEHEKNDNPPDAVSAKISPNSIRGQVDIPDDSSADEDAVATGGEVNWGKKARKRQRQVVRKLLEAEEQRLRELEEAEEDKELEEFLIRNCATGE